MARAKTIIAYAEERLRKGDKAEDVWRGAQETFPQHCVSWLYILRINRKIEAEQSCPPSSN